MKVHFELGGCYTYMNLQFHCDEKLSGNLYNLRNCLNMKSSHVDSKNLAGNGFFKNLDFFENFLPTCPNFILSHCSEFKIFFNDFLCKIKL